VATPASRSFAIPTGVPDHNPGDGDVAVAMTSMNIRLDTTAPFVGMLIAVCGSGGSGCRLTVALTPMSLLQGTVMGAVYSEIGETLRSTA